MSEHRLFALLESYQSVIVAFSGGVDSAYLGWAATKVLGSSALCITADSPSYPDHHRQLARRVAADFGLRHEFVQTGETDRPEYRANPVNRCYYCKHELYSTLTGVAGRRGFRVVADGSNADDRSDYRPGRTAAREFGVASPLDQADLDKGQIRELSRRAGLPTWDEPASACLSSRIPYHSEVTSEKLRMIEHAEAALRDLGFRVCRVRHHDVSMDQQASRDEGLDDVRHGPMARIEFGNDEMARALESDLRGRIEEKLRALGYVNVEIDPRGYRMGSLNEGVRLRPA